MLKSFFFIYGNSLSKLRIIFHARNLYCIITIRRREKKRRGEKKIPRHKLQPIYLYRSNRKSDLPLKKGGNEKFKEFSLLFFSFNDDIIIFNDEYYTHKKNIVKWDFYPLNELVIYFSWNWNIKTLNNSLIRWRFITASKYWSPYRIKNPKYMIYDFFLLKFNDD